MNDPFLIQRAVIQPVVNPINIDALIDWDYMGAAEYEYGAIGESWEAVREARNEYTTFEYTIGGVDITIFCKQSELKETKEAVQKIYDRSIRFKEAPRFYEILEKMKSGDQFRFGMNMPNLWWDIKNHFVFWLFDFSFESKFLKLIHSH